MASKTNKQVAKSVLTLILNYFLFIYLFLYQHIKIISKESCDTEDWTENSASITGIHYIFKHIKVVFNIVFKYLKKKKVFVM